MPVRRYAAGAVALCCLVVGGCRAPESGALGRGEAQRLLDARARAVLERDERAYLATEDRAAADRGEEFGNLAEVPLTSWTYRVLRFEAAGPGRARVRAELGYRLAGYDSSPLRTGRSFELRRREGRWYVADERPAERNREMFWEQGPVDGVRGAHSLVLGVGQSDARLRDFARLADRAVPRVTGAWGTDWRRRVIVLVPRSLDDMAALLGAEAAAYAGIAAVTTGEAGASGRAPADRVIVNPEAFGLLGDFGRDVVMTHETTHVATRAHTTEATPLWLSEGFADWAGYRGTGRQPRLAAPELTRAVQSGRVPAALPADRDFAFGAKAAGLSEAYEGAWLACRLIADRWGEHKLREVYRAVGSAERRTGAVDAALKAQLGVGEAEFTRQWREYLRQELTG